MADTGGLKILFQNKDNFSVPALCLKQGKSGSLNCSSRAKTQQSGFVREGRRESLGCSGSWCEPAPAPTPKEVGWPLHHSENEYPLLEASGQKFKPHPAWSICSHRKFTFQRSSRIISKNNRDLL